MRLEKGPGRTCDTCMYFDLYDVCCALAATNDCFFSFSAAIIYQCSLVPRPLCVSLGMRLISVLKQLLERVARLESEQIQQFKSTIFSFHLGCG